MSAGRLADRSGTGPRIAWAQTAETGRLPFSTVAGFAIPGLVLDLDATLVRRHAEKKMTFGYYPLLCFQALAQIPTLTGTATTS